MRLIRTAGDWLKWKRRLILGMGRLAFAALISTSLLPAYTVLTHEAIIDAVWDVSLKNVLLKRFPGATPEELAEAHAYAYGGCIIQDMGYYPFGSRFFSDLTHYVRSGDFIVSLIRESQNLDEYAFALGALEHYAADTEGHRLATNRAVPILFSKLRRKYGSDVTYWEDPVAHIRTEFGFDVLQVAAGRYAPEAYRNFIGFQVSKDLLERAFRDTYDLELKDVFGNLTIALGTYRHTVSSVIPEMTRVAWNLKKEEFQKDIPGITRRKFLYNISRSSYEREWGTDYQKPGLGTRILTFLFRIVPKIGPFRALSIRTPTPEVEKLFMASFNITIDSYKKLLAGLDSGKLDLPNENLDAGGPLIAGVYEGTDEAYAKLLDKLVDRHFAGVKPDLRENILAYYKDLSPSVPVGSIKKEKAKLTKLLDQLNELRAASASADTSTTDNHVGL